MKAETVFEVDKALNYEEQKKLYNLIKIDFNQVSKLDLNSEIVREIANNLPSILNVITNN